MNIVRRFQYIGGCNGERLRKLHTKTRGALIINSSGGIIIMEDTIGEHRGSFAKLSEKNLEILDTAIKASRISFDRCDKKMTFNLNILDVLNVSEIHLTKALAWFLDPNESHRQKDLFLNHFLLRFCSIGNIEELGKHLYTAAEENLAENGRLDIIAEFDNFSIILENKLWGKDDSGQLDKYFEWLENHGKNYKVVFLSMKEQNIANLSWSNAQKGKLIKLTYRDDIYHWLKCCRQQCVAPKVESFIDEVLQWIEFNVRGENEAMSETEVFKKMILEDYYKFEMLWDINNVLDLKRHLDEAAISTAQLLNSKIEKEYQDRYEIDYSNYKALFERNDKQGWINLKIKTGRNTGPGWLSYTIEKYYWSDGMYVGISRDSEGVSVSNEQEISDKIKQVCKDVGGEMIIKEPDAWWIGSFLPPSITEWNTGQYEKQMAWYICNQSKREELVNDITQALDRLIEATENMMVETSDKSHC